jgi:formylglycine-generating enzyme required for sulfatase activity
MERREDVAADNELPVIPDPIPPEWEETILACLAKDPKDRPATAGEVARRLSLTAEKSAEGASIETAGAPAPEPRRVIADAPAAGDRRANDGRPVSPKSKSLLYAGLAAALAVVACLGYYFGASEPAQRDAARRQQAEEQAEHDALGWVNALPLTASDGEVAAVGGKIDLYAQSAPAARAAEVRVALEKQKELIAAEHERLHLANARGGLIVTTTPPGAEVAVGGFALEKSPATLKDIKLGKYPVVVRLPGYEDRQLDAEIKENEFVTKDITLVRSTGEAQIASNPPGLAVDVRSQMPDAKNQRVTTPVHLGNLPTGDYELTFHRDGWPDQKQTLSVQRNQTASALAEFIGGGLEITSVPSGAEVWSQNKQLGTTPLNLRGLVPGSYDLEFRLKGYQKANARGEVQANATARATATLDRIPFPSAMEAWENTLGMKFVPVPGTGVLFSVWDTRVQDFEAFVQASGYDATAGMETLTAAGWSKRGNTWKSPGFVQWPTCPVCGVSWNAAKAFCAWLTQKERAEGRLGANQEYRLPTDVEWSVAVGLGPEKGGTPREKGGENYPGVYPWGAQWPPPHGAGNFAGEEARNADWPSNFVVIPGYNDGFARTSPVGSFAANKFGLYDMGGNVGQWCEDWYDTDFKFRVNRGGSFIEVRSDSLQSSTRGGSAPGFRRITVGFRCVIALASGQ